MEKFNIIVMGVIVELKKFCFLHRKILYLGTYLANTD